MSNQTDLRRWELIFKELDGSLTAAERTELNSLQDVAISSRKLVQTRKLKPGELSEEMR